MRVVVFGSEALALELETSFKPGIEVVTLGAPIDSTKIESVVFVVGGMQYLRGEVHDCLAKCKDRIQENAPVKIIVV